MKAGTVGTKGDVSKATSGRSDDGDDGSWNGEMKEAVPPESRKLKRKRQSEGVMVETRKAGTGRRRKVVPPESNESGIEESNLALW